MFTITSGIMGNLRRVACRVCAPGGHSCLSFCCIVDCETIHDDDDEIAYFSMH